MKAKIGKEIISKIKMQDKPFEIYDTEMKGFTLRVQPTGTLIYLVRYRWNGKQTRVVIGKHPILTPAQARDDAKKILAGLIHGVDPSANELTQKKHTLKSFIEEEYSPWVEANPDHKDSKGTIKRLRYFVSEYGKYFLEDINERIIEQWRTARLKAARTPATINRDISVLKSLFTTAVKWEHISANPLTKLKPIKLDNSRVRYLNDDEEKSLLEAIDDRESKIREGRAKANKWRAERGYPLFPDLSEVQYVDHVKPMVLLSMHTGIRWGELVQLAWKYVNIENAMMTVLGRTSKTGKTRHIPLNTIAVGALKAWMKQSGNGTGLVFPGAEGKTRNNIKKAWNNLLKTAQINNFRWHDLRHNFASKLVMAGEDLNTVRELLGHSDLKMTLRYAHLSPEHKASAVARLVK
jgi:integrase